MDGPPSQPAAQWQDRADAILRTVTGHRHFDLRRGLFGTRHALSGWTYSHLWPFACAWSALETSSDLTGPTGARAATAVDACTTGLGAYASRRGGVPDRTEPVGFESSVTAPLGRGGDVFYDDNAWVALALLEHHRRHQDPADLALARRVVAFCCTGWASEQGWSHPGGIRWKVSAANRSRNACANAPVAEAAALVHARTGDASALEWAVRIYDWVRATLLGPDDLYVDRITPDGTRATDRWTYNQGTMIGAGVLLTEATGDPRFLADACGTAEAALAHYDVDTLIRPNGPAFNAIFFRNLLLLDRAAPDFRIEALAAAYATCMWETRERARGSRVAARSSVHALAPLAELFALLAGATPHP